MMNTMQQSTNNGLEAQNRVLKYSFVPRHKKSLNLSTLITILVDGFLPESYQKYLYLNYKQSSSYRSYKDFVPEYLHGRPRATILHCLDRKANSAKYSADDVRMECARVFSVRGSGDKRHTIEFGSESSMPSCTCTDWKCWHLPCKHMFCIFRLFPDWNWYKLPKSYLESPHLTTDNEALSTYFAKEGITKEYLEDQEADAGSSQEDEILMESAMGGSNMCDIPKPKV